VDQSGPHDIAHQALPRHRTVIWTGTQRQRVAKCIERFPDHARAITGSPAEMVAFHPGPVVGRNLITVEAGGYSCQYEPPTELVGIESPALNEGLPSVFCLNGHAGHATHLEHRTN